MKFTTNTCAFAILVFVGLGALITQLAAGFSIGVFKLAAVVLQVLAFCVSVYVLRRKYRCFNPWILWPYLAIMMVWPFINITLDVMEQGGFKAITDGFILVGDYYQLPLHGLALVVCMSKLNDRKFSKIILDYAKIVFPFVVLGSFVGLYQLNPKYVGGAFSIFGNLLIPLGVLVFIGNSTKLKLIGASCLLLVAGLTSVIGARSYLLVTCYLLAFAIISIPKNVGSKVFFFIAGIGAMMIFGSALTNLETTGDLEVVKKLQLEDLTHTVKSFLNTGDFETLFYWQGNSRQSILFDAFWNFDVRDWWLGRGIFATYTSFVERNTIEIGWAQELFWFGTPHVLVSILVSLAAVIFLLVSSIGKNRNSSLFFVAIIMTRVLDGFVYGMPNSSVYMLLFWTGVGFICLDAEHRSFIVSGISRRTQRPRKRVCKANHAKPRTSPFLD